MQSYAIMGTTQLRIPARGGVPERVAQMAIRCAPMYVYRSRNRKINGPATVEVNLIWAIEINPTQGIEPVEWMLLTLVATMTLEQAIERLPVRGATIWQYFAL